MTIILKTKKIINNILDNGMENISELEDISIVINQN